MSDRLKELEDKYLPMEQEDTEKLSPTESIIYTLFWVLRDQSFWVSRDQSANGGCKHCINTLWSAIDQIKSLAARDSHLISRIRSKKIGGKSPDEEDDWFNNGLEAAIEVIDGSHPE